MSIVYDYADIGAQMKGDTWWQAEKPEPTADVAPAAEHDPLVKPEPDGELVFGIRDATIVDMRRALNTIQFLEVITQSIPEAIVFGTSLPPVSWRKLRSDKPLSSRRGRSAT